MFIVAIHLPTNRLSTHKAVVHGDPGVGLQQVVSHRRRSSTTMATLITPTYNCCQACHEILYVDLIEGSSSWRPWGQFITC